MPEICQVLKREKCVELTYITFFKKFHSRSLTEDNCQQAYPTGLIPSQVIS